ncbi:Rab-like protein 3 [Intoshia linei]|uniref:Rab-like protein 3 n=1 Tax=Intoshia linei TaxID=1819745 RepID=A0A177B9F3_9BILA|nr:Rab-like protein 3 [Intoshia linei]
MNEIKVKILVVGDSGTGKTSLVHYLCHNEPVKKLDWTIGCSSYVKFYSPKYKKKRYILTFYDIGGCTSHKVSRKVFYQKPHGIILVYDHCNKKSKENLINWLYEIFSEQHPIFKKDTDQLDIQIFNTDIPILIVATHYDTNNSMIPNNNQDSLYKKFDSIISNEIFMSTQLAK